MTSLKVRFRKLFRRKSSHHEFDNGETNVVCSGIWIRNAVKLSLWCAKMCSLLCCKM